MKLKYYTELDGVRTIAAFMVMFLHYFNGHPLSGNIIFATFQRLIPFGQGGVTLFFVLSGFLITRILLSAKEKKYYFRNFYVRRILRIFPLYFLFLFIFYLTFSYFHNSATPVFSKQLWYWLYVQNISDTFKLGAVGPSHFWSLAIEEQFYLFWPLVILITPNKRLFQIIMLIILGSNIIRVIMVNNDYEVFYFTLTRMDELALGSLIAAFEFKNIDFLRRKRVYLVGSILFLSLMVSLKLLFPEYGTKWIQIVKYPLMSLFSFMFILYVMSVSERSILKRFMNTKILRHLGKISYGLYVYHPISFMLIDRLYDGQSFIANFVLSFGMAITISHFSYILFENQFLKLKSRFTLE